MDTPTFKLLQDYLVSTNVNIPVLSFAANLLLAAFLSFALSRVYARYADALSNRRLFGRNFMMITMTTMLIISIVKSSLALSLGLVGALSIVRFRAAIKEPEELAYLFLSIGIGLGLGANQTLVTIVGLILIVTTIIVRKKISDKGENHKNLFLTVNNHNPHKVDLEDVLEILKIHCTAVDLRRFDENKEELEACFLVEFGDFEHLNKAKSALQELSDAMEISFLDNKGAI